MGLRGPAPKPTVFRIQEGNPSKRPINHCEPQYERRIPKCPDHLDKDARREWRRLAPLLFKARLLTEADYIALGNLCQAYSTMKKAQAALDKSSLLLKTPSGYIQQSPLIGIINHTMAQITGLCREFGLTPSSRVRLSVEPEDATDELERILSGPPRSADGPA